MQKEMPKNKTLLRKNIFAINSILNTQSVPESIDLHQLYEGSTVV
jgi:hypothetical protein